MGELWRDVSELMVKRPILWVPVLVADLLGFLTSLGRGALLRALVLHQLQYRSVLGGAPTRTQLSAAAMQQTNILAFAVTWTSYLLRMLLYAAALVTTAALVRSFAARAERPLQEIVVALRRYGGSIISLSLRTLALYAAAAALFGSAVNWFSKHGHKSALANHWFESAAGILLSAALAFVLPPIALRALSGRSPSRSLKQHAQLFAFLLGLVALAIAYFVNANIRTVRGGASFSRFLLELSGSWIVALPYAVLFTGLGLLVLQLERTSEAPLDSEQ